jgi:hypothetical protein
MTDCTVVQERLADEGIALMDRDAAIRAHVADCADCAPFAASLKRIDAGLTRLPPIDAPASLIEDTVRTVAGGTASADGKRPRDPGDNRLVTALAATVILAAGFGLVESVQQELDGLEQFYERQYADASRALGSGPTFGLSDDAPAALSAPSAPVGQATRRERNETREQAAAETQDLPAMMMYAPPPAEPMPEPVLRGSASQGIRADTRVATDAISPAPLEEIASMKSFQAPAAAPARKENKKRDRQLLQEPERMLNIVSNADADRSGGEGREDDSLGAKRPASATESAALEPAFDQERRLAMANQRLMTPGKSGRAADAKDKLEKRTKNSAVGGLANVTGPRQVAKRFLAEQERLTGLAFQSATGYWANTYVPGDPAIRLLEARLQRWDRSMLTASLGDARLESAARQNWQPFDVPGNAALAAYLHADKPTVDGRSRLRVQVGLQASEKRSGLRPDMNVGVVLDLRRPLDDAAGTKLRALVNALTKARQPGDRFSITVAGHPGGLIVGPEDFRHGPIQVAMQSLFTRARDSQAPAMDLLAAMDTATDNVRQGDDASAPLGASLVLLVSTAPIAEQRRALESMAHENAVAGIGLSVVAVGAGADLAAIDHLVLLGQGHRRVLAAADGAAKLVDRELHAASRAVARAVRLRIRLAPGVELIDVLGSENLSERAAQRVREAEQSIDRRMARNIGIRADRGDDEEGIQIVIPSFFAGDSHAVLLDVVVPGPGPVADVSVRYKDLVYRRNGVARARLAIADGHRAAGPLERNVLKNQLAYELAHSATAAGELLARGDRGGAIRTLSAARELITGMRQEIPGWDNDDELRADEALLAQYLAVIGPRFAGQQQHRLADSLRYLAYRRLISPHD